MKILRGKPNVLNLSIHRENLSILTHHSYQTKRTNKSYRKLVVKKLDEDRNTWIVRNFVQSADKIRERRISKAAIFSSREELILPGFGGLKLQFK